MMILKKIIFILLIIFNLAALSYLLWPIPVIPDLPDSPKSNLPGDTIQISNVAAYFTHLTRDQVMAFYRSHFKFPLTLRLNHPPEKARTIFIDTTQSYYLEELVIPLKGSLFVNGYEWEKDVFTKAEKRITNQIIYQDKVYPAKITIRTFIAPPINRLLIFFLTETLIIFALFTYPKIFKNI